MLFSISMSIDIYSQTVSGVILDSTTKAPLEYVNIGIIEKNIGTVSDENGKFSIDLSSLSDQDTILISCIGYNSDKQIVKDYRIKKNQDILLVSNPIELNEIVVSPTLFKNKILGNKHNKKIIIGGFENNEKGFECGVLLKIKKSAILEKFTCNIAKCTYDSIFYRLNVYKQIDDETFENILQKPIYIKQKIEKSKTSIELDLSEYNLKVEGNTLITLEHISDMGEGNLLFSGGFTGSSCYSRKTSQGNWKKIPIKLGFNVTAKVEE